jgi:hypothetical protein
MHQVDATYVNRLVGPARGKLTFNNLRRGVTLLLNLIWHVGIVSDYRRPFWRVMLYAIRRGQIDGALGAGFAAHHLIKFSREAVRGDQNASFYSRKLREAAQVAEGEIVASQRKTA